MTPPTPPGAIHLPDEPQPVGQGFEVAVAQTWAISMGLAPPVVQVGDFEYQSDLAPLDSGIMIGGTQYGKL